MVKSAVNQFDTTPGNNTDVNGVGVGVSMTVDNTNDAFQHLMALIAQQMGEVGALSADIASAASTDLSAARGWFVNITGTNTISAFGTVPAGKMFRLRIVNGLTITYNAVSMILPNAVSLAVGAGDIVTMLSLGSGNWRMIDSSPATGYSVPAGSIVNYAGATAPAGWLFCNGAAVSRTGFPLLYAAIGIAYGAGDGSTTFNVPDFRGRAAVGDDLMGTSAAGRITTATVNQTTRGGVGGAQTIVLTEANLAAHNHAGTSAIQSASHTHTVAVSGTTSGRSAVHTHLLGGGHNFVGYGGSGGTFIGTTSGGGQNLYAYSTVTGTESADHNHTFADASSSTGVQSANHTHTFTTDNAGSGTAHSNLQPSLIVMRIIKT